MTSLRTARIARDPTATATLDIAYTPDSDDVFNFFGWEQGFVKLPGWTPRFSRNHIAELNQAALRGDFDVVAISSVLYPLVADKYWILSVGSSVGRGYGPVLVTARPMPITALSGKRVAVAGLNTTGGMLANLYCPHDTELVPMAYDTIASSILRGEVAAGVMIHEELVHYPQLGLHRVRDLGAAWTEETGLPLPVGLSIVRKSLGRATAVEIARAAKASLLWSLSHSSQAMKHVSRLGRGCAAEFVPMFSNNDTLCLPEDVRVAMRLLFDRLAERGWAPPLDSFEVIDA